jgi:hypothetical protein
MLPSSGETELERMDEMAHAMTEFSRIQSEFVCKFLQFSNLIFALSLWHHRSPLAVIHGINDE